MTESELTKRESRLGEIIAKSETSEAIEAARIGWELLDELRRVKMDLAMLKAVRRPGV